MSLSSYFIKTRKQNKLTQRQFAERLGISEPQIRNIEKGRSKEIRRDLFDSLVAFVGKDINEVTYDVYFRDDQKDYGYKLSEINKLYMTSIWNYDYVVVPAVRFENQNASDSLFDGIFWISSHNYCKVLLGNFDKSKYLPALQSDNVTNLLTEAIYKESLLLENIKDLENVKELRFVLDMNDPEEHKIFDEISKLSIKNLGRTFDISFVLFDNRPDFDSSKTVLYYATNRKAQMEI